MPASSMRVRTTTRWATSRPTCLRSADRGKTGFRRRRSAGARHRSTAGRVIMSTPICWSPAPSSAPSPPPTAARSGSIEGRMPTIAIRTSPFKARERPGAADFGRGLRARRLHAAADFMPYVPPAGHALPDRAGAGVPRASRSAGAARLPGRTLYFAPNPPFGAVFTYYLRTPEGEEEGCAEAEKKLAKEGKTPSTPPGGPARGSGRGGPAILSTVSGETQGGAPHSPHPPSPGIHRAGWDLRFPPPDPTVSRSPTPTTRSRLLPRAQWRRRGFYQVEIAQRVDGKVTRLRDRRASRCSRWAWIHSAPRTARPCSNFSRRPPAAARGDRRHLLGSTRPRLASSISEGSARTPRGAPDLHDRSTRARTAPARDRDRAHRYRLLASENEPTPSTSAIAWT